MPVHNKIHIVDPPAVSRRHRKGQPIHGILLLDKPADCSSNQALQRVKRLFGANKAGHTGSLDPLATGMLPVCFGEATKLSAFLLEADKGYEATLQLGVTTDSADVDGTVLERRSVPANLTRAAFEAVCVRFIGQLQQVPPMVSAIRIDGQRLYKLAREGKTVERPARAVTIYSLSVLAFDGTSARLAIRCSKGTYIRSLVSDIGEAIGCGAHVTALRRTFVAPFNTQHMVSLPRIEHLLAEQKASALQENGKARLQALLLPPDAALVHLPRVQIDNGELARFRHGQAAAVVEVLAGEGGSTQQSDSLCRVLDVGGCLAGLGELDRVRSIVTPKRVLQWS